MLEYWYQAIASEKGIKLETNDILGLQRRLYKARAESADPELANLALVPSPTTSNQLWIIKRGPAQSAGSASQSNDQSLEVGLELVSVPIHEAGSVGRNPNSDARPQGKDLKKT